MVITTARLVLDPLRTSDADEMVAVLADARLYEFTGGSAPTLAELRAQYRRWARVRSPDGTQEWLNWVVRLSAGGRAVGWMQATVYEDGARADIAWLIGTPWQSLGYASEAARALVAWLDNRAVRTITAHVHADHHASAAVATRAGLAPTNEVEDGEIVWRRQLPANRA